MRKVPLINNEYYHIYNRGVDKRDVFLDEKDYVRFLTGMREFNCIEPIGSLYLVDKLRKKGLSPFGRDLVPLVAIIAYCLNPNHYHFILKQNIDKGISSFMHRISSGYSTYFNEKYKRSGALFQGTFKAIHIDSNELLIYLSSYVNCNSEVHGIAKAEDYKWCSFPDYIGKRNGTLCDKEIVLGQYKLGDEYKKSALENAKDIKRARDMGKLLME
jgi:putative transposase